MLKNKGVPAEGWSEERECACCGGQKGRDFRNGQRAARAGNWDRIGKKLGEVGLFQRPYLGLNPALEVRNKKKISKRW